MTRFIIVGFSSDVLFGVLDGLVNATPLPKGVSFALFGAVPGVKP